MPSQLTTLSEGLLTSTFQIHLEWTALTTHEQTGGAPITSYNLQWDAGLFGLSWEHLVGYEADSGLTDTSYIVTQGVLGGYEYRF